MNANEDEKVSTEKKKGGWKAAIFIIFVEIGERFAYYGLAGNLINYLTNNLGLPIATAAKEVNTWIGVSCIFPLFGAFLADSYFGRFKTILASSIIYLLGMIMLLLSVSIVGPAHRQAVFFTALYVLAIGEGGHKPCVQTFAADQFDENTTEEKKAKSSFFNWWYLGIVIGATSATFIVIYIQDHAGWTAGTGMLTIVLGVALVLFLAGKGNYRMQSVEGSPFTRVVQVFVAAVRKRCIDETREGLAFCMKEAEDKNIHSLAHTNRLRFLDKAMIIDNQDASRKTRNPWRLCTVNQVEEVKLILTLIPVWLTCLMYMVVISNIHTFFTKQAGTMIRSIGPHFQIPPGSVQGCIGITILVTVLIYERVFVPLARNATKHPAGITMLQRIGIGLFLSIIDMVIAALVETKRLGIARDHGLMNSPKAIIPMRVWWMLPQYMLIGIADVYTVVGLQELFYDQMPVGLRSLGAAAHLTILGIGSFASNVFIYLVQVISSKYGEKWLGDNLNRARLDYFYWVTAGVSALNFCVYIWIARNFVYKKVQEDKSSQGVLELSVDRNVRV